MKVTSDSIEITLEQSKFKVLCRSCTIDLEQLKINLGQLNNFSNPSRR